MERSLKIAVLNPYSGPVAEVESCQWLSLAAKSLGHEAIVCHDERDVQDCSPDFVLNLSFQNPKLTRYPTYGLLNLPTSILMSAPRFIRNCLTYDAAFVLAPSVAKWYSDLCFGVHKPANIFPLAVTTHAIPLEGKIDFSAASIAYAGTNWDGRRLEEVFEILAPTGDISFYGPPENWLHVDQRAVKGLVPFDGESLLRMYRKHGIGLALAHPQFVTEQIPHNRIFEVAASGALAISSDYKLVRDWFGDNFLYVDQTRDPRQVADDILAHLHWVRQNPEGAAAKARAAQQIFRERFAMDRFLAGALEYHRDVLIKKRLVARVGEMQQGPCINVVVRAGAGSCEMLGRALGSLAAQTYSRITVLLVVSSRPEGFEALIAGYKNGLDICVIDCHGGDRRQTLWAGLRQVDADYFAIMDGSDEFYENHFALLIDRINDLRCESREVRAVFSGSVWQNKNRALFEHARWRDNPMFSGPYYIRIQNFGAVVPEMLKDLQAGRDIMGHAWLANSDLLDDEILSEPEPDAAADSCLLLKLLEKADFEFNYEVTTCVHVDKEECVEGEKPAPGGEQAERPRFLSFAQRLRGLWGVFRYGLPPDFDRAEYLRLNPDVAQAKVDPVKHFREHGRRDGRRWR